MQRRELFLGMLTASATYGAIAEAAAATDEPERETIRTDGYAVPGDGGGGLYRRVTVDPGHDLKITDRAGEIFELVPEGGLVSVRQAGAVGDGDRDDATAFRSVAEYCRAKTATMFIPAGEFVISDGIPQGPAFSVQGISPEVSRIYADFSEKKSFLDFTSFPARLKIGNLHFEGTAASSEKEAFLTGSEASLVTLHDITLKNATGIALTRAFGTHLQRLRALHVFNPIRLTRPNGSSVRDFYANNFTGTGIYFVEGLSGQIENVVCERGGPNGTAIRLSATQNVEVNGLYTEGSMGTDIYLSFKSGRANLNTKLRRLWLNSSATKPIHAQSYRGLVIEDVVLQTPAAAALIDLLERRYWAGPIHCSRVVQIDQNHAGFVGDVRDSATQALIPLCADNTQIRLTHGHPSSGESGAQGDDQNIANNTVPDGNGNKPILEGGRSRLSAAASPQGLSCTSSTAADTYGAESTGIVLLADDFGSVALWTEGVISNTAGGNPESRIRVTNATTGETAERGAFFHVNGSSIGRVDYLPLRPGRNRITYAIKRTQKGSGANTYSVVDVGVS